MQVDKAGRYDQAVGLDLLYASAVDFADFDDLIAIHSDIRLERITARAVDYIAAPDD